MIEQGTLARRAVTTGRADAANARIEILQGANRDAVVLAMKFDNLREGQKASVATPNPGTGPGPSAAVPTASPK
jgi:membrane fusion protein, multidrug efflux system